MTTFLPPVEYYAQHQGLLEATLDHLVDVAALALREGNPGLTFSLLATTLNADHNRTVTVATLALMRLAGQKASAPVGTPEAKLLRGSVPDELAQRIVTRSRKIGGES